MQEKPRYRQGWRGLGEIFLRQDKKEEFSELVERLLHDEFLQGDGLLLRGRLAASQGDVAQAREDLEGAVRRLRNDAEALEALCKFVFEQAEPREAEPALQELIRQVPELASAHHNLGTVYFRMANFDAAVKAYEESLRYRPDAPGTYLQLGYALQSAGRLTDATGAFEHVLQLEAGNSAALEALDRRKQPQRKPLPPNAPRPGRNGGVAEEKFSLRLRDRTVELPVRVRGTVDRAILRDLWERDVYGVGEVPKPPATVLDIGAHIGIFSLMAAEKWRGSRIIACEADPDNCKLLRENVSGRQNIETVEAAIVAEDVAEVSFNRVTDKINGNSGGGSCVRPEPGSVPTRVSALSILKLWKSKNLSECDLLKLDCEGAEIAILSALRKAGLLRQVHDIVGEWHSSDAQQQSRDRVMIELRAILQSTHEIVFNNQHSGREGHFRARLIV